MSHRLLRWLVAGALVAGLAQAGRGETRHDLEAQRNSHAPPVPRSLQGFQQRLPGATLTAQDVHPPPRAIPQRPRADRGAGALAGRIVSADDGRPLQRAQVRVESPGVEPRDISTDADGRFQLSDLSPGLWTVTVSKAGYVRLTSGQIRPTGAPAPVRVTNNQLTVFDAALVRGGAIVGSVMDELGDPVAGAAVQALRARLVDGQRRLTEVATDQTDDMGAFRLHSLPPGDYYVTARFRVGGPEEPGLAASALATFYPGTSNIGEARRVSIRPGDERGGITFGLASARAGRLSGVVQDAMGRPTDEAPVELIDPADGTIVAHPFGNFGLTQNGGRFTFLNVSPGSYLISALVDRPNSSYSETALVPVTVGSGDSAEVSVRTAPAGTVTGSVVVPPGAALPRGWRARIWARPGLGFAPPAGATLVAGQPFALSGVSGPTSFGVVDLPKGWALQQIEINGSDVTDGTIDIAPGARSTARVVLTNKIATVSGDVTTNGAPVPGIAVLVFAADPTRWRVPSRFVALTRTDAQGRFSIEGLPPSEYLGIAAKDLDEDEYLDAEVLLRLRNQATPVTVADGSPASLRLSVGR